MEAEILWLFTLKSERLLHLASILVGVQSTSFEADSGKQLLKNIFIPYYILKLIGLRNLAGYYSSI